MDEAELAEKMAQLAAKKKEADLVAAEKKAEQDAKRKRQEDEAEWAAAAARQAHEDDEVNELQNLTKKHLTRSLSKKADSTGTPVQGPQFYTYALFSYEETRPTNGGRKSRGT